MGKRNSKVCDSQFIVSNTEQYFLALDQLEELDKQNNKYLLEPIGRNTAPAIALACMSLPRDEIVFVTPSDHLIKDEVEYKKVLIQAKKLASEDNLVTFGIKPTFAETGFGYIEANNLNVKAFHEKPDAKTAQRYVEAGNYYWNSGMFCFKAGVFLDELKKYSPKIFEASNNALGAAKAAHPRVDSGCVASASPSDLIRIHPRTIDGCAALAAPTKLIRIKHEDMLNIPDDSIDYAVMEKSQKVKVVPSDIDWSDVGSFDALYEELPKDENSNTKNDKYIATVDVEDLIIVDTGDALLVSKKGSSQKVKQVVSEIEK